MKKQKETRMDNLTLLKKKWESAKLLAVFYYTTFIENALLILKEQKIIANKSNSICKEKNRQVSLSDGITKGIVEFFGNVTFEFDAISLYRKKISQLPLNINDGLSDIKNYDEAPFLKMSRIYQMNLNLT